MMRGRHRNNLAEWVMWIAIAPLVMALRGWVRLRGRLMRDSVPTQVDKLSERVSYRM